MSNLTQTPEFVSQGITFVEGTRYWETMPERKAWESAQASIEAAQMIPTAELEGIRAFGLEFLI